MQIPHLFRFGVVSFIASDRQQWQQRARDLEAVGYDVLLVPDHLHEQFSPLLAALSAAEATEHLHVGTFVCAAGLRHPVMLAKEAATLGVLTDGRFELGLGAGWLAQDYHPLGIAFGDPAFRATRFEENLEIIMALLAGRTFHYEGAHYRVEKHQTDPPPTLHQHVPVLVGGGGRRVLTAAASSGADIISFTMRSRPDGSGLDPTSASAEMLTCQVQWVEKATRGRSVPPERNLLLQAVVIGPKDTAVQHASKMFGIPEGLVRETPHLAVGPLEEVVDTLIARREQFGITYLAVFDQYADAFAPVIERFTA
jgi:probable F420-dependent oxidoreductase